MKAPHPQSTINAVCAHMTEFGTGSRREGLLKVIADVVDHRDPLCQDPWRKASTLTYSIAGAANDQDRHNGLGHVG
jgi:hypothetical protein